jgi:hypothetical protein
LDIVGLEKEGVFGSRPLQFGTNGDGLDKGFFDDFVLQPRDVLVLGTNGIFDNLLLEQISAIIGSTLFTDYAQTIVEVSQLVSLSVTVGATPYSWRALQSGLQIAGGYPDDTSVFVIRIS